MKDLTTNIKIWRFLAFVYDILFILLLAFTVYMLFGLIFKMDSEPFQRVMIYITLAIIISYLLFGEAIYGNTFGKYLFGIRVADAERYERPTWERFVKRGLVKIIFPVEGLILLISKSKRRLGDSWSKCIVVNNVTNRLNPLYRALIGVVVIVALYFAFSISLGLAASRADFYKAGTEYLTASGQVKITGLPAVVSQNGDTIDFGVPVSIENQDKFMRVYLARSEGKWNVYKYEIFNEHLGVAFSYNFSLKRKK